MSTEAGLGPTAEPRGLTRARAIALYLPQFYPTPENDEWWGPGFTEWTNVSSAKPQFRGHAQPKIPGELGFYDLRLPETRAAQAELARTHGIEAFCYWHYWSLGRRLLERPLREVLASGEPDFPFCLAWANGDWTRTWVRRSELLRKQEYSDADDVAHGRWLAEAFADPRYVTVDGRPLFIVYQPANLPDPHRTTDTWREMAVRAGVPEPRLLAFNSFTSRVDSRSFGFDGTIDFEPQLGALPHAIRRGAGFMWARLRRNFALRILNARTDIFDYQEARAAMKHVLSGRDFPSYPTVMVSWDNTPRFGADAIIMVNCTPEAFEAALEETVESVLWRPPEDRLVFVNAWNEWAEGNYLEPDREHGRRRLEAVRRVLLTSSMAAASPSAAELA
jgi:hypothetical protein